jgi:peptide/nickel transport system permease protein
VYQDPRRPIKGDEATNIPENPQFAPPSRQNLMGTNNTGVDVFAQLVHGTRIALLVGFVATGIAAVIGIIVGAVAGYTYDLTMDDLYGFTGIVWLDWILFSCVHLLLGPLVLPLYLRHQVRDLLISRVIEVFMCIPTLVLILALLAIVERTTIWHVMIVIGLTSWTSIARLMRAEFLRLSTSDYVTAARALGARNLRIMFFHILPNALAPVMVPIAFGIAASILTESALSFLGFGAQPDDPSWGTLLKAGQDSGMEMWWLLLFPGLAVFLSVLAYNLIGEGIQESTDPRLREAGK